MADIENLSVLPRPRNAWQSIDAGFSLARAHYINLVILWLGFALPIFVICSIIQSVFGTTTAWSIMLMIWWWFKPLYELPQMMYLSRALFSEKVTLIDAWKMALENFGLLFKTYLTFARLSSARSLTYPVVFLERLPRKKRRARINTLTMVPTRHYLLMLACLHIEYFLSYSIVIIFVTVFIPEMIDFQLLVDMFLIADSSETPSWYWPITGAFIIAGALVAPFYVAGGFLVYINRRMHLEAWDIEHRFRRIVAPNKTTLMVLLLAILTFGANESAQAEERSEQLVAPIQASSALLRILNHEEFGTTKTRKLPKFNFDKDDDEQEENQFLKDFRDWLSSSTDSFANTVRLILWGAAIIFVLWLLYTLRRFRRPTLASNPLKRGQKDDAGAMHHPLTQNLPDDIVGTAQSLLEKGERRQALSVLFRGALRSVMDQYDLKINKGATESDCKSSIANVANGNQIDTFSRLLGVWQKEAYANQPQQEHLISTLIQEWNQAFSAKASAANVHAAPDA